MPLKTSPMQSPKSIFLITALIISGLNAGFYFAWQVSVIPGTKKIGHTAFLETMQSINRAILNPAFFAIFFGGLILLLWTSIQLYGEGRSFNYSLAALALYVFGTLGITIGGNVPLNNMLDAVNLESLDVYSAKQLRHQFEGRWNRLHLLRTIFALLSFLMIALSNASYFLSLNNE